MKKLLTIFSVAAVAALLFGCAAKDSAPAPKHRKIALHGYVYRNQASLVDTVKKAVEMKVDGVVLSKTQFIGGKYPDVKVSEKMTPEQRAYLKKVFADNKIEMASFGIYAVAENELEQHLAFCKDMNIKVFTEEMPRQYQAKIDALAKKYGVEIAVHHHGRKTNEYWNPEVLAQVVAPFSNIGVCADNGHWVRAGVDICGAYKTIGKKLKMLHFKDVIMPEGRDTYLGGGSLDVQKMLATLDSLGFDGYFVLEYEGGDEKHLDDIMRKSIEYLRAR